MSEEEKKYMMIPVLPETKERVDHIANKAFTYDEFINRLLDLYEKKGDRK